MSDDAVPSTSQLTAVTGMPLADPVESRRNLLAGLGLAFLVFALYIVPAAWRPLTETAEARVALAAREMRTTGDWLVPHIGDEPRFQKPPLPYWLVAGTAQLIERVRGPDINNKPVSELATVAPSACFGALAVFMVVLFGAQTFGRSAGVWAGLIMGLSFLFVRFSQFGTGEIILTFFTAVSLIAAAWLICSLSISIPAAIALGLGLGMAILTKGHVPLVIVMGAVLFDVACSRSFNIKKVLLFVLALAIAGGISAPWYLMVAERHPEAMAVFGGEVKQSIAVSGHDQNDWFVYYFYKFAAGLLPWTPFLLIGCIVSAVRRRRTGPSSLPTQRAVARVARFMGGATLVGFIVLYLSPKQQDYYLLPLIPPLALAAGYALSRLNRPGGVGEERMAWFTLVLGVALGIGVVLVPLIESSVPWFISAPVGVLTAVLYFVAARQWAEGNPLAVGLSVGLAAYAAFLSYAMIDTLQKRQEINLAFQGPEFARMISDLPNPQSTEVYAIQTGYSNEELLYYLNRREVSTFKDLLASGLDENGRPRLQHAGEKARDRILICSLRVAQHLRYPTSPSGEPYPLQIYDLPGDNTQVDWEALKTIRTLPSTNIRSEFRPKHPLNMGTPDAPAPDPDTPPTDPGEAAAPPVEAPDQADEPPAPPAEE